MEIIKKIIADFPIQFEEGLEKTLNLKLEGKFSELIICGMGNSALPADILKTYIHDLQIPLYIHRTYGLPSQADQNSLLVIISYSGNTEETISSLEEATRKGLKPIVITAGGKLKDLSQEHNLPLVLMPNVGLQSRFSLGYSFGALLGILGNLKIIEDRTKEISGLSGKIKPLLFEEQGRALAQMLRGKIPMLYASYRFKDLARVWKIKLNETAKIMSFWNYFPELNHNEMAGFTNPQGSFHFIIIRDITDSFNIQKRMQITADLILEQGMTYDFVELKGRNLLEKLVNGLILGDWLAYYLALLLNQNPTIVEIVEDFKRRLQE